MVVRQLNELLSREHICQESKDLHVDDIDLIVSLQIVLHSSIGLSTRTSQLEYTLGYAKVPLLLGLILKVDHGDGRLQLDLNILHLVHIQDIVETQRCSHLLRT